MSKKKGTSTEIPKEEKAIEPNALLQNFLKENNLDFHVSVFNKKHVFIPGEGFVFFDKPQLIYKAEVMKNG